MVVRPRLGGDQLDEEEEEELSGDWSGVGGIAKSPSGYDELWVSTTSRVEPLLLPFSSEATDSACPWGGGSKYTVGLSAKVTIASLLLDSPIQPFSSWSPTPMGCGTREMSIWARLLLLSGGGMTIIDIVGGLLGDA